MANLCLISAIFICLSLHSLSASALTALSIPDIELRAISVADDIINGEIIDLKKATDDISCASYFVKIKVHSTLKKHFKEGDIAEIFLVSNPDLLSLGDTVLVGVLKHDKKYSTSKCDEGVLGIFYSPTSSFTDSSTNISLAKTIQGTDLVYFESCNTEGKFFYEDRFLKQGYKVKKHTLQKRKCRSLMVPKDDLIHLIKDDLNLLTRNPD